MRWSAVLVLALLLAGCAGQKPEGSPQSRDDVVTPDHIGDVPERVDDLTAMLDPASNAFQDFLVEEDRIDLPGGGSVAFQTGRGMHCAGDADNVTTEIGWVACMARLVSKPTAFAQDVHDLGIGYDVQRLTLRMAAEPVEWRFKVGVMDRANSSAGNVWSSRIVFDSGWRTVDLTPTVSVPVLTVVVQDPCDAPAATEDSPTTLEDEERRGAAILFVNFTATHGAPFVEVDLGRSLAGEATSTPFAGHATSEHGIVATYPPFGDGYGGSLAFHVDLEAAETVQEATPTSQCQVIARELQTWQVRVGVVGADGRSQFLTRSVDVEVLLAA